MTNARVPGAPTKGKGMYLGGAEAFPLSVTMHSDFTMLESYRKLDASVCLQNETLFVNDKVQARWN